MKTSSVVDSTTSEVVIYAFFTMTTEGKYLIEILTGKLKYFYF